LRDSDQVDGLESICHRTMKLTLTPSHPLHCVRRFSVEPLDRRR
jgi:hypothetical protein